MILLFRLLSRLPLGGLHALGAVLGWLAWLLSPTYRRHMRENMVLALGEDGMRRVRPAAIAHAGRASLEVARIWPVSYTHLDVYKRQASRRLTKYLRSSYTRVITLLHFRLESAQDNKQALCRDSCGVAVQRVQGLPTRLLCCNWKSFVQ